MKRTLILCVAVLVGLSALFACKKVDVNDTVSVESVSLDHHTATLVIGDNLTLHATVKPSKASNKKVSWSSSKPAVADVDNTGKVTAKSEGTAVITVKTSSGGHTDQCEVEVVKEQIAVTGVSLSPDDAVLKVGGKVQLSFELKPSNATNHKVTWSSDREDIATVKDGLVTAVAQGTANITVKTADGGHEATVPVKVVQSFTKITITAPNTSDSHYDAAKQKYFYSVGESFQLTVETKPEGAEDEIVFDGYTDYCDIEASGKVTAKKKTTKCQVVARSKADPDNVKAVFVFDILPQPESIRLIPDPSSCSVAVNSTPRMTECIGLNATQVFTFDILPKEAVQTARLKSQTSGTGKVSFSVEGNKLIAKAPASGASDQGTSKVSTVVLEAAGYTQTFTFKVTKFDPYQPKVGDVITYSKEIGDGGYRGNGIFDDPVYTLSKVNCMIAHLGDEHTKEDPLWNDYKPKKSLTTFDNKEIHGIAIPFNITKLYRKSEENGEIYYEDNGNDNYIEDSGNLPSWVKTSERKALLRSNSLKHTALMNTCCHVYCNSGRGSSYEIRPFNFFIEDGTKAPSSGESNSMDPGKYLFSGNYVDGKYISGGKTYDFNASAPFESNFPMSTGTSSFVTPWLLPTIADFMSIFTEFSSSSTGVGNYNNIEYTNSNYVLYKIEILMKTFLAYNRTDRSYNDIPYWLANETGQNKFVQGYISGDGATFKIDKQVPHKDSSKKGFVLPIRYF